MLSVIRFKWEMTFFLLRLLLIFLLLPAVARSEMSAFVCKNEISSEKRIFKLEKTSGRTVVYTLFEESFYPLCDSPAELPQKGGVVCVYGKGSNRKNYVATFFKEDKTIIIDFLIDKNDTALDSSKWKQKSVSYCNEISKLNF